MVRINNLDGVVVMFMLIVSAIAVGFILLAPGLPKNVELPRPIVTSVPGLNREHHDELNRQGIPDSRYDELRGEYKDDLVAQQQIDVYDGSTEYHEKFEEYVNAIKEGNQEKIAELEEWFETYYPDI